MDKSLVGNLKHILRTVKYRIIHKQITKSNGSLDEIWEFIEKKITFQNKIQLILKLIQVFLTIVFGQIEN